MGSSLGPKYKLHRYVDPLGLPGPPKYVKSWHFMAVIVGLGLLCYILLGFRYSQLLLTNAADVLKLGLGAVVRRGRDIQAIV